MIEVILMALVIIFLAIFITLDWYAGTLSGYENVKALLALRNYAFFGEILFVSLMGVVLDFTNPFSYLFMAVVIIAGIFAYYACVSNPIGMQNAVSPYIINSRLITGITGIRNIAALGNASVYEDGYMFVFRQKCGVNVTSEYLRWWKSTFGTDYLGCGGWTDTGSRTIYLVYDAFTSYQNLKIKCNHEICHNMLNEDYYQEEIDCISIGRNTSYPACNDLLMWVGNFTGG